MPIAAIVVIAVVVALSLAAAAVWWLGYPLGGLDAARAAAVEAGERTADVAADFVDWIKLGS